jgi:hypothetical protein
MFSEFGFDADGLVINFSPYEVLAYAYGPQEVRIPWEMLRNYVAAEFQGTVVKRFLN